MKRSTLTVVAFLIVVLMVADALNRDRRALLAGHERVDAAHEQVARAVVRLCDAVDSLRTETADPAAKTGHDTFNARRGSAVAPATRLRLARAIEATREQLPGAELVLAQDDVGAQFFELVEPSFPDVPQLETLAESLSAAGIELARATPWDAGRRQHLVDLRAQVSLMSSHHRALERELSTHRQRLRARLAVRLFGLDVSSRSTVSQ